MLSCDSVGKWKAAEKMTSLNLKKMMNLPREHQEETLQEEYLHVVNMVEEPSESHVSTISDVKGVTLSQAKMKVDKVREPAEPQEIIRNAMGELRDVLRWDEKVQGRNKNNYNVNEAVEIKKFEEYLSLFCSSSTRRDPGLYHAVYTAGNVEHMQSHAMATQLFLWTSRQHVGLCQPDS